jgi:hypothetical protein
LLKDKMNSFSFSFDSTKEKEKRVSQRKYQEKEK